MNIIGRKEHIDQAEKENQEIHPNLQKQKMVNKILNHLNANLIMLQFHIISIWRISKETIQIRMKSIQLTQQEKWKKPT